VKQSAFLITMQRFIGSIQIQDDFFGCLLVRFNKQINQQILNR
jgi:hypothetical protein